MPIVLLLGGARSGKSRLAAQLAADSGAPVTFIATAAEGDEEMAERIRRHRETRPPAWSTVEAPIDLVGAVRSAAAGDFLVVDCLTLWVSNLMGQGVGAAEIDTAAEQLVGELQSRQSVVVTNEVGLGIVPVNALARSFRDVLGSVNVRVAESAERAILMVAGRGIDLMEVDRVKGLR